jgi:hypothetical protein
MGDDPIEFRRYAEECRRLANDMPAHRATLLEIAEAWIVCAERAERKSRKSEQNGSRPSDVSAS